MFAMNLPEEINSWLLDTCNLTVTDALDFKLCIADYSKNIEEYYNVELSELEKLAKRPDFGPIQSPFGLSVTFHSATPVRIHDSGMTLDERLRAVIRRFGVLALVNAYPTCLGNDINQHNTFPSLRFHIDRGAQQPNQISMFVREHDNPEHRNPRASQTLFVANAVAHLQALQEGRSVTDVRSATYEIFHDSDIDALSGSVILNHPWQAPPGQGEIILFDNRDVLHASYQPDAKGYPIGVRYLY